jgi:hypothetical protein
MPLMSDLSSSLLDRITRVFAEATPGDDSFTQYVLEKKQWRDHGMTGAARPGIYVWTDSDNDCVVRVGISAEVARARALQHIRDDTGKKMAELAAQNRLQLILFVSDSTDSVLLRRIEKHLENHLDPVIPSQN